MIFTVRPLDCKIRLVVKLEPAYPGLEVFSYFDQDFVGSVAGTDNLDGQFGNDVPGIGARHLLLARPSPMR